MNTPNDLGDATYGYPLPITDQHSRYILGCAGMSDLRRGSVEVVSGRRRVCFARRSWQAANDDKPSSPEELRSRSCRPTTAGLLREAQQAGRAE